MTINRAPYYVQEKDRWYADKSPGNKWTYVWDVSEEVTFNNTLATQDGTSILNVDRMTVLQGPTVQDGKYVKIQVAGPSPKTDPDMDDASVRIYIACDDSDGFEKTLYFKQVQD